MESSAPSSIELKPNGDVVLKGNNIRLGSWDKQDTAVWVNDKIAADRAFVDTQVNTAMQNHIRQYHAGS